MFKLAVLAIVFISAQATAEVCIQNDTNIPEAAFNYGFSESIKVEGNPSQHPIATPSPDLELRSLDIRENTCLEYKETVTPGTPGHLVIYVESPANSTAAYANEYVAWITDEPMKAAADSTLMLSVSNKAEKKLILTAKLNNDPFRNILLRKVFVYSQK